DLFGHLVVSMRPFHAEDVDRVREITREFRAAHGEPVHWGDPEALGIRRLDYPDEGDAVPLERGEIPVFWGGGVTPHVAAIESRMPYVIVNEPGHTFVTDLRSQEEQPCPLEPNSPQEPLLRLRALQRRASHAPRNSITRWATTC